VPDHVRLSRGEGQLLAEMLEGAPDPLPLLPDDPLVTDERRGVRGLVVDLEDSEASALEGAREREAALLALRPARPHPRAPVTRAVEPRPPGVPGVVERPVHEHDGWPGEPEAPHAFLDTPRRVPHAEPQPDTHVPRFDLAPVPLDRPLGALPEVLRRVVDGDGVEDPVGVRPRLERLAPPVPVTLHLARQHPRPGDAHAEEEPAFTIRDGTLPLNPGAPERCELLEWRGAEVRPGGSQRRVRVQHVDRHRGDGNGAQGAAPGPGRPAPRRGRLEQDAVVRIGGWPEDTPLRGAAPGTVLRGQRCLGAIGAGRPGRQPPSAEGQQHHQPPARASPRHHRHTSPSAPPMLTAPPAITRVADPENVKRRRRTSGAAES
jgi:hypothetical protein